MMKHSKRKCKLVQQGRLGIISRWLCLSLLILMLAPGAVFGSGILARNIVPGPEADTASAAVYEAEPPVPEPQIQRGATVKDSVYRSVYQSVYEIDPTLGVILNHGAYQMSLMALSNVEGSMSAVSPLLQQIRLSQASGVVPGGAALCFRRW